MFTQWQLPPVYSVLDPLLGRRKPEEGEKLQGGFSCIWSGVRQSTSKFLSHLDVNEEMEIPSGYHLVDQRPLGVGYINNWVFWGSQYLTFTLFSTQWSSIALLPLPSFSWPPWSTPRHILARFESSTVRISRVCSSVMRAVDCEISTPSLRLSLTARQFWHHQQHCSGSRGID